MTFKEKIAGYVIGFLKEKDIPEIGVTGLSEGLISENLNIMAGLSKTESPFVLHNYLTRTLRDLNIEFPAWTQATLTICNYYVHRIITRQVDPYEGFKDLEKVVGPNTFMQDTYNLGSAYHDYIILWETITDGLEFYDKNIMTREQFIAQTKEDLVNSLKKRTEKIKLD